MNPFRLTLPSERPQDTHPARHPGPGRAYGRGPRPDVRHPGLPAAVPPRLARPDCRHVQLQRPARPRHLPAHRLLPRRVRQLPGLHQLRLARADDVRQPLPQPDGGRGAGRPDLCAGRRDVLHPDPRRLLPAAGLPLLPRPVAVTTGERARPGDVPGGVFAAGRRHTPGGGSTTRPGGDGTAAAVATGTATDAVQCGHCTCCPAYRPSATTSWPHPHLTSIPMAAPPHTRRARYPLRVVTHRRYTQNRHRLNVASMA